MARVRLKFWSICVRATIALRILCTVIKSLLEVESLKMKFNITARLSSKSQPSDSNQSVLFEVWILAWKFFHPSKQWQEGSGRKISSTALLR